MEWFKKHTDTVIVLSAILSSIFWMNGKFNDLDKKIYTIETRLAIIETVLIMKDIMPKHIAAHDEHIISGDDYIDLLVLKYNRICEEYSK